MGQEQEESGGITGMVQKFIDNKSPEEVKNLFTSAGEKMDQSERSNVIKTMTSELQSKGFDIQNIASQAGLSSTNPDQMGAQDLGGIAGFVKEKAPYVIPMVVEKMPQLAKHLGINIPSGLMEKAKGLFGGGS